MSGPAALIGGGAIAIGFSVGFAPLNYPRALLFLGDVGSYFIGAWIAVLGVPFLLLWQLTIFRTDLEPVYKAGVGGLHSQNRFAYFLYYKNLFPVASMEGGQLPLQASLAAYKRGAELLAYCQTALKDAEQQVLVLEKGVLKAFKPDGGADG